MPSVSGLLEPVKEAEAYFGTLQQSVPSLTSLNNSSIVPFTQLIKE
jgi:hypothetical protein